MVKSIIDVNEVYNEIARKMLSELLDHLKDKPIIIQIGDTQLTVKISKVKEEYNKKVKEE